MPSRKGHSEQGEVKFYNQDEGYGFIISEEGREDVYFKGRDVKKGWLEKGDKVEFERVKEGKTPRAKNIIKKRGITDYFSRERIPNILKISGGTLFSIGFALLCITLIILIFQPSLISNPSYFWELSVCGSAIGFSLFLFGWMLSKTQSKYGWKYRDPQATKIIRFMVGLFSLALIIWIGSIISLSSSPALLTLNPSWAKECFLAFFVAFVFLAAYMGSIRRRSWWTRKKTVGIGLIVALVILVVIHPNYLIILGFGVFRFLTTSNIAREVANPYDLFALLFFPFIFLALPMMGIGWGIGKRFLGFAGKLGGATGVLLMLVLSSFVVQGVELAFMPSGYYAAAEDHVKNTYGNVPHETSEDLTNFLMRIDQFPPYSSNFTCSESSARLEWLLEGAGFDAYVVTGYLDWGWITTNTGGYHAWVMVVFEESEVIIESTYFDEDYYSPPGIVGREEYSYRGAPLRYREDKIFDSPFETTVEAPASVPISEWNWWEVSPYKNQGLF